jgi:ABC-type sugar transport system substrate-binding protein
VTRRCLAAGVLAAAVLAAAGCGSSKKSSTSSSTSTPSASANTTTGTSSTGASTTASSGTTASGKGAPYLPGPGAGKGIGPMVGTPEGQQATAAGTAAGKALGKASNAPHPAVGYLDILAGIESADRVANSARQALKALGYKMLYCNGAGNPQKWVTCGNTLLSEGAKAIILTGIDPSAMPSVVKKAKSSNVPIVDFGGLVGPGFTAAYYPDETKAGKILAQDLIKKIGSGDVAVADYPATWAKQRTDQLKALVKGSSVKISASSVTDPTNLVQGTQKTVTDQLTANPNLKAFWFAFDSAGQAGAQVIAGKSAGNKPAVYTFHADPSTQVLMHKGAITEVVDVNYDVTAWEALDALAEHFARGKALSGYTDHATYKGIGDPLSYQIVTKDNLPPQGQYVAPKVDGVSFFLAKWKAEGLAK